MSSRFIVKMTQNRKFRAVGKILCALAALSCLTGAAEVTPYTWTGVERVVAISDPHGDYDAMTRTLAKAGIIDAAGNWVGGESHLVITGDLLDRGADSRRIMDLVMALEIAAAEQGGRVHLTLGNHEVMNLVGDLRYVSRAEYAAFADDETPAMRERWFRHFVRLEETTADAPVDELLLRQTFDRDRPRGLYALREAFSSTGHYGRWLLEKPYIVVINGTAYVHGGLSPLVAEVGLQQLNHSLRQQVSDYLENAELLIEKELLDPALNFYDHAEFANSLLATNVFEPAVTLALERLPELAAADVHSMAGPLWYRGNVGCSVLEEGDLLDAALASIGADRVVIGHTPTVTRHVLSRFDGRVIEIDTGMLNAFYRGSGNALVIEGGSVSVVNETGSASGAPVPHPRRVGDRADELDVDDLERALSAGEILATRTTESGQTLVDIRFGDQALTALFSPSPRRNNFRPAIAAYRLDRLIGLDKVPATVAREVDGQAGTLQFLPARTMNEAERAAAGQGGGAWCPLQRQWNAMYLFDTLIYHDGRAREDMRYNTSDWQLMLTGNTAAFDSKRSRPPYLENVELETGNAWSVALKSLTDARLAEALGDVLDRRRLTALGKRRDLLVEEAAGAMPQAAR